MATTQPHSLRAVLMALGTSLALLPGCGDSAIFSLNPGHIDGSSQVTNACFEGAKVELVRYSTRCERASAEPLTAEVGDGLEFAADSVRTLEAPCAEGPSPAVEIRIGDHQLVFDFSEVASPGRFPGADFEGYVIDLSLHERNGLLLATAVDTEASTLPVRNVDIYHEPDHIEVNFQDLPYDERGLVKIDLLFASVSHQRSEVQ